jgi:hypothetical protein
MGPTQTELREESTVPEGCAVPGTWSDHGHREAEGCMGMATM